MGKGSRRPLAVGVTLLALLVASGLIALATRSDAAPSSQTRLSAKLMQHDGQGTSQPGGDESAELLAAQQQWDNQRTQGSVVAPGAYSAALSSLEGLAPAGGSWSEITRLPYDADDPDYRDYYSNSSLGSGLVSGRITAIAADDSGYVYAGGADGGVWRSSRGGGRWTPIADALPSLSSGDLELASDGSLWYATGEANTGGTSYVGTGVYRLANPRTGTFARSDRVGGTELESTTIRHLRFANGKVWAATLRGIYSHPAGTSTGAWTRVWSPQPSYLPGGSNAGAQNAAYMNIVNDVAIDPNDASHMLAASGWRSGAAYNGFYESHDGGASWVKINPAGGLDATDIGFANFAYAGDGSTLYVINESPRKLNSFGIGRQQSLLDGVYASKNGLVGPWNRIASADKLGATSTGSALANVNGQGYSPGVQAWYNQFIKVDPANPNHVFVGLEEVYETTDGGTHWRTIGPYWNYGMPCWAPDALYPPNGSFRCPLTTHSDQHAIAFGTVDGKETMFVGNDGGIYKRGLHGPVNSNGNATDWVSLNDGTMDALQYYAVDAGLAVAGYEWPAGSGKVKTPSGTDSAIVSGGLQDNGGSITRTGGANATMSSNFGGDGGDALVDPDNGCRIVQEYVVLAMRVTESCARPDDPTFQAFLDQSKATTFDIAPPDVNARFIAPFVDSDTNKNLWLAGGASVWFQDKGYAIRSGSEWTKVHSWANAGQVTTALAMRGNTAIAAWCGPCNNAGFARGAAVGTYNPATKKWSWGDSALTGVPSRYISGVAVDDSGAVYVALNGFSRRFTEGPGAGIGHLFKSTDGGATWTDISGNMPDIPTNALQILPNGKLVVGTDLGVIVSSDGGAHWSRLGGNFPATVAIDVEAGPDGRLYAATHGRGIWRITTP